MWRAMVVGAVAIVCATAALALAPAPASAFNPAKPGCVVGGLISGLVGKACAVLQKSSRLLSASKKLLSGHIGGAAKALLGEGAAKVGAAAGLAAAAAWVLVGAKAAIKDTASLIAHTTSPQLETTWFSATYWRMAAIAAVLTLPFLCAAAVQAIMRSDLGLLARAALIYLPLALLAVSIAAPVTMLLLAASDEMSAIVSSAAGSDGGRALVTISGAFGAGSLLAGSPFLAFLVGLLVVAAAFMLWLELLMREAAVYVVVLMLPLAFAALVWPARRVWAIRAVEVLVALILSKFAIVAVLTLAAAGLGHSILVGPDAMLAGLALVTLAAFAPWAVVRLLPMAELASGTAGSLRREATVARASAAGAETMADRAEAGLGVMAESRDDPSERGGPQEGARAEVEKLDDVSEEPVTAAAQPSTNGHVSAEPSSNGSAPEPATSEHRPGLPDIWLQSDMSWPPIILGPEDEDGEHP